MAAAANYAWVNRSAMTFLARQVRYYDPLESVRVRVTDRVRVRDRVKVRVRVVHGFNRRTHSVSFAIHLRPYLPIIFVLLLN